MDVNISDEELVDAANQFMKRVKYEQGDLVRQKKHFHYLLLGDTTNRYTGNMAFVEWLPGVIGSNDCPMHPDNLLVADCIVIAHNGKGGVMPILMDSRFLEPAVPSVSACDLGGD